MALPEHAFPCPFPPVLSWAAESCPVAPWSHSCLGPSSSQGHILPEVEEWSSDPAQSFRHPPLLVGLRGAPRRGTWAEQRGGWQGLRGSRFRRHREADPREHRKPDQPVLPCGLQGQAARTSWLRRRAPAPRVLWGRPFLQNQDRPDCRQTSLEAPQDHSPESLQPLGRVRQTSSDSPGSSV